MPLLLLLTIINVIITADVTNITISTISLLLLHSKSIVTLLKLPYAIIRYCKDCIHILHKMIHNTKIIVLNSAKLLETYRQPLKPVKMIT